MSGVLLRCGQLREGRGNFEYGRMFWLAFISHGYFHKEGGGENTHTPVGQGDAQVSFKRCLIFCQHCASQLVSTRYFDTTIKENI